MRPFRVGLTILVLMATTASFATTSVAADVVASVINRRGEPVEDAVISLVAQAEKSANIKPLHRTAVMSQSDSKFNPFVLPILVGTEVRFPNKDSIGHHVYSFSKAKTFELKLYGGDDLKTVKFDKPGTVVLGCNIHDSMIAYIYVVETPYFAKTGTSGKIVIDDLPAGAYLVQIWHPRIKGNPAKHDQKIVLAAAEQTELSFELSLKRKRATGHKNSY